MIRHTITDHSLPANIYIYRYISHSPVFFEFGDLINKQILKERRTVCKLERKRKLLIIRARKGGGEIDVMWSGM